MASSTGNKWEKIFEKHPQFRHFPLGISRGNNFLKITLAKWPSLLGISEEVIKMASILMPQQKSRSRKRHQFWCHRRKSAPIWSLVLSTTDKIRQFWAENKLFSRKAHKNRFFVLSPLRDKKISFNPQFLAFLDGYPLREKKFLSKWFIFGPSRCLPDGREIFKIIHKNRVFMLYPLEGKNYSKKLYIFRAPVLHPLRGSFGNFGSHS